MTMEKQSTLNHDLIKSGRMVGNTTRLADYGIDLIFQGKIVVCEDHHENGEHSSANKALARVIINRLCREHWMIQQKGLINVKNGPKPEIWLAEGGINGHPRIL
jgi:hypothetical protein